MLSNLPLSALARHSLFDSRMGTFHPKLPTTQPPNRSAKRSFALYLSLQNGCHSSAQETLLTTMKKIFLPTFFLICVHACLTSCKKSETPSEQAQTITNPSKTSAANPSAEKNSFQEVTSHLDPGGNLYLYFSTEQMLAGLSAKVSTLRQA